LALLPLYLSKNDPIRSDQNGIHIDFHCVKRKNRVIIFLYYFSQWYYNITICNKLSTRRKTSTSSNLKNRISYCSKWETKWFV